MKFGTTREFCNKWVWNVLETKKFVYLRDIAWNNSEKFFGFHKSEKLKKNSYSR